MSNTDMQALLEQFTSTEALSAISKATGVSKPKVKNTLTAALPLLVAGMKDNADSPEGQASLEKALSDHAGDDAADAAAFLQSADAGDGAKILQHILGDREASVQKELAKRTGTTKAQTKSVLSSVAPLLLTLLGQQNQSSSGGLAPLLIQLLLGNNSGGLFGSLLGGSGNGGSLLGSLFGDDSQSESGGSLLDSLFGEDNENQQSDSEGGLLESLFGGEENSNDDSSLGGELLGSLLGGGNSGSNSSLGGQLLGALLSDKKSGGKKKTGGRKKKKAAAMAAKRRAE